MNFNVNKLNLGEVQVLLDLNREQSLSRSGDDSSTGLDLVDSGHIVGAHDSFHNYSEGPLDSFQVLVLHQNDVAFLEGPGISSWNSALLQGAQVLLPEPGPEGLAEVLHLPECSSEAPSILDVDLGEMGKDVPTGEVIWGKWDCVSRGLGQVGQRSVVESLLNFCQQSSELVLGDDSLSEDSAKQLLHEADHPLKK